MRSIRNVFSTGVALCAMVATEDHALNPDLERFYARRMNAHTTEVRSSHVPGGKVATFIELAVMDELWICPLRILDSPRITRWYRSVPKDRFEP